MVVYAIFFVKHACSGHALANIKHSNCEICRKMISEPTDRDASSKNFIEDLQEQHRRIKENLEKSAEDIKSSSKTSLKRGVNIVAEGSSMCFIHGYTNQVSLLTFEVSVRLHRSADNIDSGIVKTSR